MPFKRYSSLFLSSSRLVLLLTSSVFLASYICPQASYSQAIGPVGPVRRIERPAPPSKSIKESFEDATGGLGSKFKDFFKNTGRTVETDNKTSNGQAEADVPSTQSLNADAFMLPAGGSAKSDTAVSKESSSKQAAPNSAASYAMPRTQVQKPSILSPLPPMQPQIEETATSTVNPPQMLATRIDAADNPLGIAVARKRVEAVERQVKGDNPPLSLEGEILSLRRWLIDATEAHVVLYESLKRLPSARVQAEFEKQLALEFGKLRDRLLYASGVYYINTKRPQKSVNDLVQVIESQSRSELGLQAYEKLQKIGFTEQLRLAN